MDNADPTIYLSNWSSHRTPGHHGPGRKFSIMARPRAWEWGSGVVFRLRPHPAYLSLVKIGHMTMDDYRQRYSGGLAGVVNQLGPGSLSAVQGNECSVVESGDTLCCACSREAASRGECHRVWAAEPLRDAGWRVVLDGEVLP